MLKKNVLAWLMIAASLALVIGYLSSPTPAVAQCGSSVSSCKNCHEVQGKDPVNTKDAWHTEHAFGDFCEFCHAGNVKAKDQALSHTGMVAPLADIKGSCQSCHPNDYSNRAIKYANTLGTQVGTGAALAATGPITTAATANPLCGPAAPAGGQAIDLNQIYTQGPNPPASTNFGNFILLGLIGATLLLFLGLFTHYEHPLARAVAYGRQFLAAPALVGTTSAAMSMHMPTEAFRPEFSALERALMTSDPATVRAVANLLADRENGPKILKALNHLDLQTLAALGESDQKALETLLALAKELNA